MDHCKEIARLLEANAGATRLSGVFDDFVELSALTLRNAVDRAEPEPWQLREKQYLEIAGRYDRARLDRFAEALAHVVLAMREEPSDVLGRLYMELGLGNGRLGQFFTPYDVARLVAGLGFDAVREQVRERGWAELHEPACGAAAFVVATAELMARSGMDPWTRLFVSAEDVSPQAVHMAYIHLSALGVPAVVHRRDTLSRETHDSGRPPRSCGSAGPDPDGPIPSPDPEEVPEVAQTFEAKYGGACASPACDRGITPGDQVVFVDRELFHDECAFDSGAPAPITRPVCPDCFTERSVSGACSC